MVISPLLLPTTGISWPLSHLSSSQLTKVVLLLEVLVDDSSAPDLVHLVTVQHSGLLPDTSLATARVVAPILGEESRHGVVGKRLGPLLIATRLERALAAPLIDVVTPEVNGAGLVLAAVEVVGQVVSGLGVVIGSIPNTEPAAKVLGLDVGLGVPHGSLDEGGGGGVGLVVGDLVAGEEADRVRILAEVVNDTLVPSEEVRVPARVVTLDRLAGDAEIRDHVDACVGEGVHARLVVGRGVDGVDTDGVGAQLLQEWDVTRAARRIRQRVDEGGVGSLCCAAGTDSLLVCYSLDEKLCAV